MLVGYWSGIGWGSRSGAARLLCVVCVHLSVSLCLHVSVCFFVPVCLFLCVYLSVSPSLSARSVVHFVVVVALILLDHRLDAARLLLPRFCSRFLHPDASDWSLQMPLLSNSSSATADPQQLLQA